MKIFARRDYTRDVWILRADEQSESVDRKSAGRKYIYTKSREPELFFGEQTIYRPLYCCSEHTRYIVDFNATVSLFFLISIFLWRDNNRITNNKRAVILHLFVRICECKVQYHIDGIIREMHLGKSIASRFICSLLIQFNLWITLSITANYEYRARFRSGLTELLALTRKILLLRRW